MISILSKTKKGVEKSDPSLLLSDTPPPLAASGVIKWLQKDNLVYVTLLSLQCTLHSNNYSV